MQMIEILFFVHLNISSLWTLKQQIFKMITNKNKVQPFMFNQQEEKNYDKFFFVKIFKGMERFAI